MVYGHGAFNCEIFDERKCVVKAYKERFSSPPSYDSSKIEGFDIINSNMSILTTEICETFPNLKEINLARSRNISLISDGALSSCIKLETFSISKNLLTEI